MEKGPSIGGAAAAASAPLPSAPPSYEEAVGLTSVGPNSMDPAPPGMPPYPIAGASMPMPISAPYVAPSVQMPHPQQVSNQTQAPEVRVVVHQHVSLTLGPNPVKMCCPSCHADIKTTTMSDHQPSAHVCCFVLCLLGCCLCSCLPYCLSAFLSVHHFCPNCKVYIGTWKG
ncbi:lipopolysaccharide-induced tumor necrosis factor-alpha factor homolog [Phymastichus coffea]|uniref:lipopolysaccharide-induced tumor necrosis factor-alpha factor homolog n=1 Tax=Phymastichus coffea TaxID=108790 RepID=UPI00273C0464|nr:lipopolysaccharide-induced tumor necrosis factor-alpha factor homolog [Phymastichus coffea]XP_058792864.1 lipopolysaccharide-induced tumor necrosis factor-alpha factor homolog [Phymastichus coffea]XP_058792865.1 lipopolysaccharide-induced tumor necrosis factor-alpha factor homolog [Phymastichus coffea]XP_058792866.1 lipopolysaccharide-induced tumor necrosis factor-alpha factor homolog [Phymastichus coffea]XP_058792867.1 lipopolysaccharide-induced tumor necrosis factor-alpha factor homolog [P